MSFRDKLRGLFKRNIYLEDGRPRTLVRTGTSSSLASLFSAKERTEQNLKKYWDIYRSEITVFASINITAWNTCMSGWSLVGQDKELIKKVRDFCDKVDLDSILLESTINALVFGDAFVEIIYNKKGEITNLKSIDPKTMWIETDKYGRVKHYYQKISGKRLPNIDPKYIMHIRFFPQPDSPYGISLIEPSYDTIKRKMTTDAAIANAIKRHGFRKWKIIIDTKDGKEIPSEDVLNDLKSEFTDIDEKTEFILPDIIDIEPIDESGVQRIEEYYSYFQAMLVVGLLCPQEVLGLGSNSTEATARVRQILYERMVKSFQNKLARAVELNIFDRITGIPGSVKMRFKGTTEVDEARRAQWIAKILQAYRKEEVKPFTINEIRQMFGFEPLEEFETKSASSVLSKTKTLKAFRVPLQYKKSRVVEKSNKVVFKDAILLTEGTYVDAFSKTPTYFPNEVIRRYHANWESDYIDIDHKFDSVLYRIGKVKNPKFANNKLKADLEIYTVTQNAKDVVALINAGLITDVSVEVEVDEEYDPSLQCMKATSLKFIGVGIVTEGACPSAKIKGES